MDCIGGCLGDGHGGNAGLERISFWHEEQGGDLMVWRSLLLMLLFAYGYGLDVGGGVSYGVGDVTMFDVDIGWLNGDIRFSDGKTLHYRIRYAGPGSKYGEGYTGSVFYQRGVNDRVYLWGPYSSTDPQPNLPPEWNFALDYSAIKNFGSLLERHESDAKPLTDEQIKKALSMLPENADYVDYAYDAGTGVMQLTYEHEDEHGRIIKTYMTLRYDDDAGKWVVVQVLEGAVNFDGEGHRDGTFTPINGTGHSVANEIATHFNELNSQTGFQSGALGYMEGGASADALELALATSIAAVVNEIMLAEVDNIEATPQVTEIAGINEMNQRLQALQSLLDSLRKNNVSGNQAITQRLDDVNANLNRLKDAVENQRVNVTVQQGETKVEVNLGSVESDLAEIRDAMEAYLKDPGDLGSPDLGATGEARMASLTEGMGDIMHNVDYGPLRSLEPKDFEMASYKFHFMGKEYTIDLDYRCKPGTAADMVRQLCRALVLFLFVWRAINYYRDKVAA